MQTHAHTLGTHAHTLTHTTCSGIPVIYDYLSIIAGSSGGSGNQTCSSALVVLLQYMYALEILNREGESTSGMGNPSAPTL